MQHCFCLSIQGLLPVVFTVLFLPAAWAAEVTASASDTNARSRPTIGLVLSGGGARGFAHIGVLRELEKARIPVDVVVGTSMGAIVGGLYAMGLSPDEIESGVRGINWNRVFDDDALRKYRMYKRKLDEYDFFNVRRIGVRNGRLHVPPGLIEGQAIETALDRLVHPAFHITDFDDLQAPFRAIATDIATGEAIVIDSGNLAKAMRASMSIPGAFPPVRYGDKLLVDGGIGNNVPVNIARDMGADIVVVVDVSDPLSETKDIESGIDITGQLTTILTRRVADQQLETLAEDDVLITPRRFDLSSTSFSYYSELITEGEEAARRQLDELRELSLSEEDYSDHLARAKQNLLVEPIIDFVEIRNDTPVADETYARIIRQQAGRPLDVPQLEEDIAVIYGMDLAASVVYNIVRHDGENGLVVYVRYRDWAPSYLRFGLSLQTEFDGFSTTNLHASYTNPTINERAGEFRATAQVGSEPGGSLEIYQPLDTDLSWFVSAKAVLDSETYPEENNNKLEAYFREQRQSLSLSGGKVIGTSSEIRLSLFRSTGTSKTVIGTSAQPKNNFDEGGYLVRYDRDTLDNISFPNSGGIQSIALRVNRQSFGSDADYEQAILQLFGATTWQRSTVFGRLTLETTKDDNAPDNALFRHGGFLDISGTTLNELSGQQFGVVIAGLYQRLGNVTFLPMYAGLSFEAGNAWNSTSDVSLDNTILAGSIFVGADTLIGPIYLAIGVNDRSDVTTYLIIGKRLGIF